VTLKKTQVSVALAGMSESVSSRVADFSTSLSLAENVVYDQTGVPRTRFGYTECTYAHADELTRGCESASFCRGSRAIVTEVGRSSITDSGVVTRAVQGIDRPSMVTTLSPSSFGQFSARQAPFNTATTSAGDDEYVYDSYIAPPSQVAGDLPNGFTFSAKAIAKNPGSAWTANTAQKLIQYEVRDAVSGVVLFSGSGLYEASSGSLSPRFIRIVGYRNYVHIVIGGTSTSGTSMVSEVYQVTSAGVAAISTNLLVSDLLSTTREISVSFDESHATANRIFVAYPKSVGGGEVGVLRINSSTGAILGSPLGIVPTAIVGTYNGFGIRYHKENDELFILYTDDVGVLNYLGYLGDLSGFSGRGAGTLALAPEAPFNTVIHITRATVFQSEEDATGGTMLCWNACISSQKVLSPDGLSLFFIRVGQPDLSSDGPAIAGTLPSGLPFTLDGSKTVTIPTWYKSSGVYFTVVGVSHSKIGTSTTGFGQESVRFYRIDGSANFHPGYQNEFGTDIPRPYGVNDTRNLDELFSLCTGSFYLAGAGVNYLGRLSVDRSTSYQDSFICLPFQDSPKYDSGGNTFSVGSQLNCYKVSLRKNSISSCETFYGSVLSGGVPHFISSAHRQAISFPCRPLAPVIANNAGGDQIAGAIYRVMFDYENDFGIVSWSELSQPTTDASAAATRDITVYRPPFDVGGNIRALVFRNDGAGDRYVGSAELSVNPSSTIVVRDAINSSSLDAKQQPYYDPAAVGSGSPLPRTPAPSAQHICQHNDRLFVIDEDNNVRYTGPMVRGESPWFSEIFKIPPPANDKPIGVASNGSFLCVFTPTSVFSITGDGPPENGGNGTEFSPPQLIVDGIGCVDKRTILQTPLGVVFCSSRGIEIIDKSGRLSFIGEPVQKTFGEYPNKVAACFDGRTGTLKVLACKGTEPRGGFVAGETGGAIFVYRFSTETWSVHKVAVGNVDDSVFCDMTTMRFSTGERTALLSADGRVFLENTSTYLDPSGNPVKCKLRTHDFKLNGAVNSRFRLYDAEIVALNKTNHSTTMSLYYNYVYTSPGITRTFEPPVTQASPEILVTQPNREQLVAVALEVSWQAPADTVTYPPGNGEGTEVLQAAINIGVQDGFPLVPATQRK